MRLPENKVKIQRFRTWFAPITMGQNYNIYYNKANRIHHFYAHPHDTMAWFGINMRQSCGWMVKSRSDFKSNFPGHSAGPLDVWSDREPIAARWPTKREPARAWVPNHFSQFTGITLQVLPGQSPRPMPKASQGTKTLLISGWFQLDTLRRHGRCGT